MEERVDEGYKEKTVDFRLIQKERKYAWIRREGGRVHGREGERRIRRTDE